MKTNDHIYLDYQATTPIDPQVMEEMLRFFHEEFGNPHSSEHSWGWEANKAIERARGEIASYLGADNDEVFFTSGATEANNIAILGLRQYLKRENPMVLLSSIEHKSVFEPAIHITSNSTKVQYIPVSCNGELDISFLDRMCYDKVGLVSVMAANNEIGTLQNLKEISFICNKHSALFHSDASQALMTTDIDVYDYGIDIMSISGHKIYGPKGIGALYIKREVQKLVSPIMFGGGQESYLRPGTLPTPLCVGLGCAISLLKDKNAERERIKFLRDELFIRLKEKIPAIRLIGPSLDNRHVGNLNVLFPEVDAQLLLGAIQPHIAASSGSACTSGVTGPSHVLLAIGLSPTEASSCIRFSIGRMTTLEQINHSVEIISAKHNQICHL